jgi:hypothetical protein
MSKVRSGAVSIFNESYHLQSLSYLDFMPPQLH